MREQVIDYTFCERKVDAVKCAEYIKDPEFIKDPSAEKCTCEIQFNLTEDFKGDVYFYYGLSNYYQNHRRYVKSRFV